MSAQDVLVRAQELSGQWVCIGSSKGRGIVVEDLTMDADTFGPRGCTFSLKRNPQQVWPDISAFTPIEIEVGGIVCWEGRVKESPTRDGADRQMSVSCEGWQYHLDDDPYRKTYVQSRLTDFVDSKSLLGAPLAGAATFPQAGQVEVGDGSIVLGLQNGVAYPAGTFVGVTLDFGPTLCSNVAVNWQSSNNAAVVVFYCSGNDAADGGTAAADNAFAFPVNTAAAAFNTGTFVTPHRYVNLFLNWPLGGTPGADIWVKIIPPTSFFASTAYASAGVSILKASDVVKDAKSKATLLLSSDTSKIQATSFSIPDFDMSGPATPREVISAVNAYHNYQYRIGRDRVPEFRPQPAGAIFVAGESGGIGFEDASANSGLDIYSGVNVTYTAPDGSVGSVVRGQPASLYSASAIQPTNPGAEVNTTGWTASAGTLTRTTVAGEFSAGVAGFKYVPPAFSGSASTVAWTGSFIAGQTYRVTLDVKIGTAGTPQPVAVIYVDGAQIGGVAISTADALFHTYEFVWTQPSTSTPTLYMFAALPATSTIFFDNIFLYEGLGTLVNRRGFRRTKNLDTNMALTPAGAQQIGDTYLTGHRVTPFKGTVSLNGNAAIRRVQGGVTVPPHELMFNTGELVRLPHLIDPDTGAIGREGRIAVVSCTPITGEGMISLDNTRNNLDALLARLATVVGQIPSS